MELQTIAVAVLHIIPAPYKAAGGVIEGYFFPGERCGVVVGNAVSGIE